MTTLTAPIDRHDLRRTRFYYFLFYAGTGFMSPFLNLFYLQQGLSGTQIGWITSLGALVTLLAAPFWTQRNASWGNPRRMLQLFLMLTAVAYFLLSQQYVFLGIALVNVFRALVSAGISPLSDSLALSITKAVRAGFGSIRVWGSFGWVVFVPLSGWLVERTSLKTSLVGAGVLTIFAALLLFSIRPDYFAARKVPDQAPSTFQKVITSLRTNRTMLGVATLIAIIGIANSGVGQFETIYLRQLGASDSLIGIAGMLSAIVELPCMLWADRLVTRYGSVFMLLTAMLIYVGLRITVLLVPAIATIMLTRAMQGFAFSFYTVALARAIGEQSAPHETRTVMALYTITLTNLVSIVGSPLTGAAFDLIGARWLYLIAALGYFFAFLGLQFSQRPKATTR